MLNHVLLPESYFTLFQYFQPIIQSFLSCKFLSIYSNDRCTDENLTVLSTFVPHHITLQHGFIIIEFCLRTERNDFADRKRAKRRKKKPRKNLISRRPTESRVFGIFGGEKGSSFTFNQLNFIKTVESI